MDDLGNNVQAGRYGGAVATLTSSTVAIAGGAQSLAVGGAAACLQTVGAGCVVAGAAAIELAMAPGQAIAATSYIMHYKPTDDGKFVDDLSRSKSKCQRKRWVNDDGEIFEWDSQHSELQKYDKRGRHLGSFDPENGKQIKAPKPGRKVEP